MTRDDALEFEVLTIFPAAIEAFVSAGLMGKAIERELVRVHCTDLRTFTHDRHRTVDDAPFGGGAGMVIKAEPVADALAAVVAERGPVHTILLTPSGSRFDQRVAERLAGERRIALLCGRYEGIDDRIREHYVDECLSIGDFVLNGGEVAAAAIIEAVARLREGVLGNPESIATESFAADEHVVDEGDDPRGAGDRWRPGLVLEHPHYTRPADFRGHAVPAVLLGGDHRAIASWRRRVACLRTWSLRPELRPRWRLPIGHPLYLAVSAEALDGAVSLELRTWLAALGVTLIALGQSRDAGRGRSPVAALYMRDLKQARRAVRKRHGRDPWLLGVAPAGPDEAELGPRVVLDTLAFAAQEGPPALIFWVPSLADAHDPGDAPAVTAWLALDPDRDRSLRQRLAIPSALIDISQPRAAPGPLAPLTRAAFEAMRVEGLLPAGPGRAPSTDRETSS